MIRNSAILGIDVSSTLLQSMAVAVSSNIAVLQKMMKVEKNSRRGEFLARSNYDRQGLLVTFLFNSVNTLSIFIFVLFFAKVSRRAIYGMRSSKNQKALDEMSLSTKEFSCLDRDRWLIFCCFLSFASVSP